jgi:uncharacterized protein (DUF2147 family)
MVRFPVVIAIVSLAFICALAPAHAEKRVALVIGNDRYANLSASEQLQKAVSDARAIGGALRQIGFDVVQGENLGRQALIDRLDTAVQRVQPGDTVFFFFSGHGVAVDGANYILPADVPDVGTGQITRLTGAAVREDDITAAFKRAGARVAVVVLDACRNNPFTRSGTRGVGGERGLAPHEPPSGFFTLYSAGRGEAALDRLYDGDRNPNSVFTRVLLPALTRADLDLPGLAVEVREEVRRLAESAGHAQSPAYYDETRGGRIFLAGVGNGKLGGKGRPLPTPTAVAPATPQQVAVVAPPVALTATPASVSDARGYWMTESGKAKIAIVSCGGALCGNIVALTEPNDLSTGQPKTDGNNPDPAKRTRPMIGVQILINMKPGSAYRWEGQVYNGEDGKTYAGSITLVDTKTLTLEGCALGGLICKHQTWIRTN